MNPARVFPAATPRMLAFVRIVICAILGLGAGLALPWVTRVEWHPLSSMQMHRRGYGRRDPLPGDRGAPGIRGTEPARPEEAIRALRDSRCQRLLSNSKNLADPSLAREFFAACGRRLNEHRPPERRIIAFGIVWRRWDFVRDQHTANFWKINKRIRFDLTAPPLTP